MRVISYNILDGGEGRADPLAEVILAQNPDIVGLVEADNLEVLHRIGKRLNMDFIHAEGDGHASALFSRFPIIQTINHAALHPDGPRSLVEALVGDDSGNEWTFGVVHLSPGAFDDDERKREQQLPILLRAFDSHRTAKRPHILLGDFNANAPVQKIDPDRCKQKTQDAFKANGGLIPRRVMQTLFDLGYVDTLESFHPAAAEGSGTFSTQAPDSVSITS